MAIEHCISREQQLRNEATVLQRIGADLLELGYRLEALKLIHTADAFKLVDTLAKQAIAAGHELATDDQAVRDYLAIVDIAAQSASEFKSALIKLP